MEEHALNKKNLALLKNGLNSISLDGNWLEKYKAWRTEEENSFDALLEMKDSFNLDLAGDAVSLESDDGDCDSFFDFICLAAFFSDEVKRHTHRIVGKVVEERNPERKIRIIEEYFNFISDCIDNSDLASVIPTLYECGKQQNVLHAKKSIDLQINYINLIEVYRGYSVECIYLLFTLWRLNQNKKTLKKLIAGIAEYIQVYFEEYNKDPDMHLNYPLEGLTTIKKLSVISHWMEYIAFHTRGIFEEYKKRDWLLPVDVLVDDFSLINQITKYEMLRYSIVFTGDNKKTVIQKAICNHNYGVWIKTTDIFSIAYEVTRILYELSDSEVQKLNTSRSALLELYDNMLKIKDAYTGIIFHHRAFYQHERRTYNAEIISAQESDARQISDSIDSVLQITSGFISDDIDSLLLAKQQYKQHLSIFMSDDQERKLDEYMEKVATKLKDNIRKLAVYDKLYSTITGEFVNYAVHLVRYPDIFSSLVSAEYLYKQYVQDKEPNDRFDYSCISIMYYMALEDFTNKLLYTSYATDVLDQRSDEVRADYAKFISHNSSFWDKKNKCYKRTCEIGTMGHLLSSLAKETELISFLQGRYPAFDVSRLISYGDKLKTIAPRRNDAAHGGNLLTHSDVCIDKKEVYSNPSELYRGLILELFTILFPSE